MKSQVVWLLLVTLLVCGTIGCGEKPQPVAEGPKNEWQLPPGAPRPAIAPFDADQAKQHQQSWAEYLGVPVEITNSIGMKLKLIPAGKFMMGSPESDDTAFADREPQHRVRITKPFYLGVYEVTQEQYEKKMGKNPSRSFKGASDPVEMVSWDDAVEFCTKLSAKEGKTYRLPTEAEWEYACRAGTTTVYSFGDDESQLGEYAWYGANSRQETHPVGEKKPNAWGLNDMHGNVSEWCADWYDGDYYKDASTDDPSGPVTGSYRVFRGGDWWFGAGRCRAAGRGAYEPAYRCTGLGFRVAAVPSGK
jgi:formylglycine-generating enzyme required for sulfatase activity